MAPRLATRPTRENDFSNVGKVGRRTGVTLPQGRVDVNGMEEISGIFSSPRKPSPLKNSIPVADSVEGSNSKATPPQPVSSRKSLPPPRSASPRKSGISGTARRSRTIDLLGQSKDKAIQAENLEVIQDQPALTPTPALLSSSAKRFNPDKTPVKDTTKSRPQTARSTRQSQPVLEESIQESVEVALEPTEVFEETDIQPATVNADPHAVDDYDLPAIGNDDDDDDGQGSIGASLEDNLEGPPLPAPFDDEEADETFEPESRAKLKPQGPMIANSRRKRKSDATSQEVDAEVISSPAAKRAKRISDQSTKSQRTVESPKNLPVQAPAKTSSQKSRGRPPLKDKSTNMNLSKRQEEQLNQIIEKHKPRPGQKSSLYVLKKETHTDNSVTHTRSGRVSFKPLAYWRNEKCVYQGSPGSAGLEDGERFPLNSIKEIIRTDEAGGAKNTKSKSKSKGKGKGKSEKTAQSQPSATDDEEESDVEAEDDEVDPDAEPWEVEKGIFRGLVATWDQQEQAVGDDEDEMDIAYAPASIETREVKGSTFRYAKLLSTKFFGSGIVDLPPGGVKKTKNSRKMHMSFFVAMGRVTVHVGAINGPDNEFSIGEGGWWQVPRGNQYSIKNVLQKPARIFFSQACEAVQQVEEE